jgi:hypothetical protein
MRRKPKLYGPRPTVTLVRKDIVLPDGTVLKDFPVQVADPPEEDLAENKVQPRYVDETGRLPRRGSGG